MIYIAHRGNVFGSIHDMENEPGYLDEALGQGFDVEVDLWVGADGVPRLGHDYPQHVVDNEWLLDRADRLWVHAKNGAALHAFKDEMNVFFHDTDDYTMTSRGFVWVYPGKDLLAGSVAVLPESCHYLEAHIRRCHAVCSDEPARWRGLLGID